MAIAQNQNEIEKANQLFSFLLAGLIAFAEGGWKYPYPTTLSRARGLLYGAAIERGQWKFEAMSDFIKLTQTPVHVWWPYVDFPDGINPEAVLIDADFQIPAYLEELLLDLDDLSHNQKFNATELKLVLDNRKLREALQQARERPDMEDAYVIFRRYLIEHPWLDASSGVDVPREARQLMGQITDYYETPSINMLHDGKYWLCPRCNGILVWAGNRPQCATAGLCERLVDLSQATSMIGDIRTLKMTFRKRVQLPGLPEVQLYEQLSKLPDMEVKLWPHADLYDLSVEKKGKFSWAIDVKDYASEFALGALLQKTGHQHFKGAEFFYAIPDHREQMNRGYLHRLRKLCPNGVQIRLVSDLLQESRK